MREIFFHSSDDGINHTITFNFSGDIKDKFTDLYKEELDNGNLLAADKYFDLINSQTDNFIVDRNYEHVDSSIVDLNMCLEISKNVKNTSNAE